MAPNILQTIAQTKHREVEAMKTVLPLETVRKQALNCSRKPLSMKASIQEKPVAVIAEHKRRSPSRGEIAPMSEVATVARLYAENGAAAMSVLTDTQFFGGSLTDLAVARNAAPSLPLLRKEFIVDEYQVYQARIFGADAVLLIAALLSPRELMHLNHLAHSLGLETLVEIHNPEELSVVPPDADMLGVNNRDLSSFRTDISNSMAVIDALPPSTVRVAESGLKSAEDVKHLHHAGFNAFLIGEALMSAPDPGLFLKQLTAV